MNEHSLAVFLSSLQQYPVKLAQKIGCQEAILWYHLFVRYGNQKFNFNENIGILLGILDSKKVFDKLRLLDYILLIPSPSEEIYQISFDKIISECDNGIKVLKLIHTDPQFISIMQLWNAILESKGYKKKSVKEINELFKDKTLDQSLKALVLSVQNRWVTLKFDDGLQKDSRGSKDGSNSRYRAGGGANKERASGDFESTDI